MVGDRSHDMVGATDNGMHAVGVLYGYGSREELEAAGAQLLISRPGEIGDILDAWRIADKCLTVSRFGQIRSQIERLPSQRVADRPCASTAGIPSRRTSRRTAVSPVT